MAGKTGTAQVVALGARRLKASEVSYFERDHAWFAAFAPAEDPDIVVVVLNEHGGFGAAAAAPVASAVVRKWLELRGQDAREGHGGAPAKVAPPPAEPPPSPPPRPGRPARAAREGRPEARRGA
jgi:penicillin-binding protein 2